MLSIIIVNHKNPPLLRLCLKSLQRTLNPSFAYEIIVTDSEASTESGYLVTEEFPKVTYVPFKENVGYTRLVNKGIEVASGDTYFIMNTDIIALKGSIEGMYQYLNADPKIGMIGPQLLNFDGSRQASCFRDVTPLTILYRRTPLGKLPFTQTALKNFFMEDKDLSQVTTADWLSGSALMVSASAVKKVGLMDENLFLYMSDVDWPRRFWENGYHVVYYPAAQMYHYHHRHSNRIGMFDAFFNRETRWHIKDAIRYFKKYHFKQIQND